ncbi:MAG: CusA/CzcA family heavy metal efflux RND transporter [Planctomycetaceae bacterium]|jgi:Cu(I)/Ag(I) efflux system membrane protein CusA/SilA|nr:CusA/CzcA family heavy metal efflux RND transporter [Planctomycetaceae bacterium]
MINALIHWSLHNRFLVIAAFLAVCAWGVHAVRTTPIDALPDLSENQVIVYADWEGRSPQEVEDQITYPLSVSLQGLAGVKTVRATSMFGFSFLTVIFHDNVETYFARTRVLERLNSLGDILPEGVIARLGPDATGLGWVYQYYLRVNGKSDLGSLRNLQDTFIKYQLASVKGVAEVGSIGGFVRQYQVEVSSLKLKQFDITLGEVMDALQKNNLNVGGKTLEENGAEFVVRGIGLVENTADIENTPLKARSGIPLYVKDVAAVQIGGEYRRGTLDVNGQEVAGGIVVMRYGENAYQVIQDIKAKIADIQKGLPEGITIEPFYDRSGLIDRSLDTLRHALVEEIILVTLAHILFLFHFRSILIVTIPLPSAILISFILMNCFGVPSHIMSLTGIAISIGVLVDAGIVMTENVIRQCELREKPNTSLNASEVFQITLEASKQVGRPMFFAMAIIILAFVPVFLLSGQEGKLFHPLAYTKTFALIGAVLLALTVVPVLCTFLVRGPFRSEDNNWLMKAALLIYDPLLDLALRFKKTVLFSALCLLIVSLCLAFGLPKVVRETGNAVSRSSLFDNFQGFGSEFMPALEEGSLLFMPVLLPATSLTEVKQIMAWQDEIMSRYPEVVCAAGKLGRAETATDPAPAEMIETTITLKPQKQWREGLTKDQIIADLSEMLAQVPGYTPGFLQPIENRVLMTSTGIRAQLGVKIFGNNLNALQKRANEVAKIIETVPGAIGVAPSQDQGKPYLEFIIERSRMGRYGLLAEDILSYVEMGLGGMNVTTTIKGRERWNIQVRLDRADRDDIEKLGELLIPTPSGVRVPLQEVCKIQRVIGPNMISSENGRLRVFVQANVVERDLGGFVDEVKGRITKEVKLDEGETIEYSGQYENQIHARQTLQIVFPVVIGIIFLFLVMTFHSVGEAAHVLLAVPFALTGGVILQHILGFNFSVAVWVGYIALFGTAIQTGIIMVVYMEEAVEKAKSAKGVVPSAAKPVPLLTYAEFVAAVKSGARLRLRPKLMTVGTTVASLLPIFWSTQTGTEIMQPLATPVVGGMISSLLHILIVTPVLFVMLHAPKK